MYSQVIHNTLSLDLRTSKFIPPDLEHHGIDSPEQIRLETHGLIYDLQLITELITIYLLNSAIPPWT